MLILIQYLSQETSKILYDAIYLGYRIEFQNNGRGLEIMVKGYSDKTDLALLEIIKLIKNVTLDSKTFDFLTRIVLRDLKNDYTEAVHKHGKEILKKILRKFYYLPNELEKEYDKIDLEDFNQFMNEFISKLFVEVLVYGNVDRDVTKKMAKKLIRLLDFKGIEKDDLMKEEILNIKDHIYYYRDFNENEIDQNNLLMNYYQYGPYEFHTSFLLNIINEKLSNDAFNYLRGELQLGYIAASFKINLYGIVGLVILVQGSVADPIIMDEKTEQFLETFSESIFKMSDEEFESITQSLIKILQEGEKEIEEKASLVWEEIRSHFYEFEKRKNAIKYLKSLKKEELIHFYRSFISQNIGKLSVQLFSQAKDNKILDDKIVDQNKTYIHVNGSSSVILSNFEIFQGIQRYKYQSGNEELEIFTNNTNINKE